MVKYTKDTFKSLDFSKTVTFHFCGYVCYFSNKQTSEKQKQTTVTRIAYNNFVCNMSFQYNIRSEYHFNICEAHNQLRLNNTSPETIRKNS